MEKKKKCILRAFLVCVQIKVLKFYKKLEITLNKEKRTSASLSLLRYGKDNFSTKKVMEKDQLIGKKYINGLEELEVVLKSKDELYATLKNTENLNSQITLKELKYPVKKGDIIGV